MPRRLLLVLVALGLFLDPAHAQSPSANRYVTGPTHLRVESVATDLNRRTTQAGSFQSGRPSLPPPSAPVPTGSLPAASACRSACGTR